MLKQTPETFIEYFGTTESLELSNLENPESQSINGDKINLALDSAFEFIMGYDSLCSFAGKIAIRRAIKRLNLDIARYFLDTLQRREDVTTNYENCIKFMEMCIENNTAVTNITDEELLELGITGYNRKKINYRPGRRAFTDESLSKFRNQALY